MVFKIKYIPVFCLLSFVFGCRVALNPNPVFIRANQVGFLPSDLKTAVVFSEHPLHNNKYQIVNINSGREVLEQEINDNYLTYDKFKYCYTIDFSSLKEIGKYRVIIDGNKSIPFEIKNDAFNNVVDSLMLFFKVQRCGPTNPYLHAPCHLSDATSLIGTNKTC
jgi:endoglucanase